MQHEKASVWDVYLSNALFARRNSVAILRISGTRKYLWKSFSVRRVLTRKQRVIGLLKQGCVSFESVCRENKLLISLRLDAISPPASGNCRRLKTLGPIQGILNRLLAPNLVSISLLVLERVY